MKFLGVLLVLISQLASYQLFAQNDSALHNEIITPQGIKIIFKENGTGIGVKGKKYLTLHYIIKSEKGRELSNSFKQGSAVVMSVIDNKRKQAWIDALRYLKVGDNVRITVPDSIVMKYWRAFLPTPPFKPIALKIRLLVLAAKDELPPNVVVLDDEETKIPAPFDIEGKDTVKTKSGLRYIFIKENLEGDQAYNGRKVAINYTGYFEDGTIFDASYINGLPYTFTLTNNEVIDGLDEGVRLMKTGDKYRLLIPYKLAYGEKGNGTIPSNTNLIFDVELIAVD